MVETNENDNDSFPYGLLQLLLFVVLIIGCAQLNCFIEQCRSEQWRLVQQQQVRQPQQRR